MTTKISYQEYHSDIGGLRLYLIVVVHRRYHMVLHLINMMYK